MKTLRPLSRKLSDGWQALGAWLTRQALDAKGDLTARFGDQPGLGPWKNFLRGARAGALATLALGSAAHVSAETGPTDFGSTDVKTALDRAVGPIKDAMCYVYNTAGPVVFLAAGIAVVLGFILKALQARIWGVFVWGGVIAAAGVGIVLAFISIFGNPRGACGGGS